MGWELNSGVKSFLFDHFAEPITRAYFRSHPCGISLELIGQCDFPITVVFGWRSWIRSYVEQQLDTFN